MSRWILLPSSFIVSVIMKSAFVIWHSNVHKKFSLDPFERLIKMEMITLDHRMHMHPRLESDVLMSWQASFLEQYLDWKLQLVIKVQHYQRYCKRYEINSLILILFIDSHAHLYTSVSSKVMLKAKRRMKSTFNGLWIVCLIEYCNMMNKTIWNSLGIVLWPSMHSLPPAQNYYARRRHQHYSHILVWQTWYVSTALPSFIFG